MVYRMLAVNIDGTLLQSNGRLNKLTKDAIEYVHQKGVSIVLVTSRNYLSAKKIAKALKVKPMIVAHQGAFVSATMEKPMFVQRISEDLTLELVQFLEKANCQIQLVHEKYMLSNRVNLPENLIGKAVFYISDPSIYSHQYADSVSEVLTKKPSAPPKIDVTFSSEQEKQEIRTLLKEMFIEVDVIDLPGCLLTIVPKGVSKWNGLLYLAEQSGIKRNEIVAIGDGTDDIDMIANSGLGVAMGNAAQEVKDAAKWVTRTQDEQGVAYMLKEFFRKQHPIGFLEKINMTRQ